MKETKKFRQLVAVLITSLLLISFVPVTLAEDSTETNNEDSTTVDSQDTATEDTTASSSTSDEQTSSEDNSSDTTSSDETTSSEESTSDTSTSDETTTSEDTKDVIKPRVRKAFKPMFALPKEAEPQKSAFFTMLQWGDVDGKASDTSELNWNIEISIDSGKAQVMGDPLLLEGIDKIDEQSSPDTITGITKTTTHWDGLIVKFVPTSIEDNNKVHIQIGEFTKDYTLAELYATHGIYDLTNGRQVAVRSFHRGSSLGSEKRDAQFNDKLAVIKRLEKIHEKIKTLIDSGKLKGEMVNSIFGVLKRLENNEYSSEESAKWVKRITNLVNKLENAQDDKQEEVLVDEVSNINTEFEQDCRTSVKSDFKEGFVPFEDTPQCDWYTDFVRRLRSANVVRGMQGTNNFAPGNGISRAELLAIALASAGVDVDKSNDSELADSSTFSDTKGHWAERGIRYAVKQGLVKGFTDGFRPNNQITRAEALAMLYKVFSLKAAETCTTTFKDVDGHWAACIIEDAKLIRVINGYEDGTFKPNDSITRAAMAKIISNLVDYIRELPEHQEV